MWNLGFGFVHFWMGAPMKWIALIVAAVVLVPALMAFSAGGAKEEAGMKKEIYHVVALKFKASATPDQIKEVEQAFEALKTKVPGVTSLHWGTNVSAEQRNKGFTHAFVLTFGSEKDRDTYLTHPAHKEFGKIAGPSIDDVFVIDFWSHE